MTGERASEKLSELAYPPNGTLIATLRNALPELVAVVKAAEQIDVFLLAEIGSDLEETLSALTRKLIETAQ